MEKINYLLFTGHIHTEDLTHVLTGQGYWPSYNTPYFRDIFNLSGSPDSVAKYGDWFTYDKTPRALIFKRGLFEVIFKIILKLFCWI